VTDIITEYLSLPHREQRIISAACNALHAGLSLLRLHFPGITPGDLRCLQSYIAQQKIPEKAGI
jgi:hypothetical protein